MNTFTTLLGIFLFSLAILVAIGATILILRELRKQAPKPQIKTAFKQTAPPVTKPIEPRTPPVINPIEPRTPPVINPIKPPTPKPIQTDNAKLYPQPIMTKAENRFYDFLKEALGERYLIETKKPLDEILKRHGYLEYRLWTMHTRGHIDFLVIDPKTKKPILAIELDDWTHKKTRRQDADRRKETLLERGQLKLLRFQVGEFWGQPERQRIYDALQNLNLR